MGLQTSATGGSFRASIWGGDNSTCPTTTGASCGFSVEGTQFAFLRLDQTFSANVPYTFTMTKAAGDWWVFTVVVNHGASPTIQLGTMHVPSNGQVNQLTNDGGQFTEYFQPGDNKTLEGDATDEATVGAPVIDGVQTKITSTQPDPLNETTVINGGTALYTNFLPNNSARDPITLAGDSSRGLLGGSSLSLSKINLATGSGVQSWVFGFDGTVRGTDFLCLTAGAGNTVTTSACPNVNVPTQTWHYLNDGEIINPATGLCLLAPAGTTSTGPLQLAVCKALANERFTAPANTKVYPISGEKLAAESITGNAPDTRTGANFGYRYLSNAVDGCAPNAVTGAFPPGLKLDAATCTLVGTPTTIGTYSFSVSTKDGLLTVNDTVQVVAGSFSGNAPNTTVGANYSFKYSTTGTAGCNATVAGPLPRGLAFTAATCTVAGTPTLPGSFAFRVYTADKSQYLDDQIVVADEWITGDAPNTAVGATYSYSYSTNSPTGCNPAVAYGSLPPGLSLTAATCTVSGTPTTAGTYTFDVFTSDSGRYIDADTIVVAPAPTTLSGDAPDATVGAVYSYKYTTNSSTGCKAAVTGTLPPGLTFAGATCTLSGKTTTAGTYTFGVSTADGSVSLRDTIAVGQTTITGQAPDMVLGQHYSFTYVTNSPGGCYSKPTYGSLPPGITFNGPTCTLSGTPTTAGSYRFNLYTADWKAYIADSVTVIAIRIA
jgi:hypothetical protein